MSGVGSGRQPAAHALAGALAVWLAAPLAAQSPGAPARVVIATTAGEITVEVYEDRAPLTAENFLAYVDAGLYEGGSFYRSVRPDNQPDDSVRIEVIQAGPVAGAGARLRSPIALERTRDTGLRHVDGALSMARGGPNTARASFFICIGDQPSLDFGGRRNPDGQGFAAFGRVVSGMDVVRSIQGRPVRGQRLLEPVVITSVRRVEARPTGGAPSP